MLETLAETVRDGGLKDVLTQLYRDIAALFSGTGLGEGGWC